MCRTQACQFIQIRIGSCVVGLGTSSTRSTPAVYLCQQVEEKGRANLLQWVRNGKFTDIHSFQRFIKHNDGMIGGNKADKGQSLLAKVEYQEWLISLHILCQL